MWETGLAFFNNNIFSLRSKGSKVEKMDMNTIVSTPFFMELLKSGTIQGIFVPTPCKFLKLGLSNETKSP